MFHNPNVRKGNAGEREGPVSEAAGAPASEPKIFRPFLPRSSSAEQLVAATTVTREFNGRDPFLAHAAGPAVAAGPSALVAAIPRNFLYKNNPLLGLEALVEYAGHGFNMFDKTACYGSPNPLQATQHFRYCSNSMRTRDDGRRPFEGRSASARDGHEGLLAIGTAAGHGGAGEAAAAAGCSSAEHQRLSMEMRLKIFEVNDGDNDSDVDWEDALDVPEFEVNKDDVDCIYEHPAFKAFRQWCLDRQQQKAPKERVRKTVLGNRYTLQKRVRNKEAAKRSREARKRKATEDAICIVFLTKWLKKMLTVRREVKQLQQQQQLQ